MDSFYSNGLLTFIILYVYHYSSNGYQYIIDVKKYAWVTFILPLNKNL